MGGGDKVNFFRQALNEVEEVTGVKVNYALWLADKDTVVDYYGRYMADKNDIDAYAVGPIVLSELGYDGTLYGYTEMPEPLEEHEIDILLAQESVQKPQKASFDDLVSDAQIRASEGSKAPQGIDFEPEH